MLSNEPWALMSMYHGGAFGAKIMKITNKISNMGAMDKLVCPYLAGYDSTATRVIQTSFS